MGKMLTSQVAKQRERYKREKERKRERGELQEGHNLRYHGMHSNEDLFGISSSIDYVAQVARKCVLSAVLSAKMSLDRQR